MPDYDPYSIQLADEPTALEMAKARAAALRGQNYAGTVLGLAHDPYAARSGAALMHEAQQGLQDLGQAPGERFKIAFQRRGQDLQGAAQAETKRHNLAAEGLESWAAVTEPVSGAIYGFNRRTGEYKLVKPGTDPGTLQPLKPQQMEEAVRKYATSVEPIAKMAPDLSALEKAAGTPDQAGFGPIAGRIPDALMSQEGVANRQAAGRLMAALLKEQSGTAVSEQEMQRALSARGLGPTATPQQFQQGVAALVKESKELLQNRQAAARPDVIGQYEGRGGFSSAKMPKGGPIKVTPDPKIVEHFRSKLQAGERLVMNAAGKALALGKDEKVPQGFEEVQ